MPRTKISLKRIKQIKSFGDSMYPVIQDGDVITIKKKAFADLHTDDIVCLKIDATYLIHRVIYRTRDYLITKGDHAIQSDGKVHEESVLGVVESVKRQGYMIQLKDIYLLQSSIYQQEINTIVQNLQKKRILFVILKGLPLHLYYEKTYPKRMYADCDILVKRVEFERIKKLFATLDYNQIQESFIQQQTKQSFFREVSFTKTTHGIPVVFDIHFEPLFLLNQAASLDCVYPERFIVSLTKKFLAERKNIFLNGQALPILSKENLIVYLALHFFHSNLRGIHRLILLNHISNSLKGIPDLEKIRQTIRKFRLSNFVFPSFLLLEKYYPTKKKQAVHNTMLSK